MLFLNVMRPFGVNPIKKSCGLWPKANNIIQLGAERYIWYQSQVVQPEMGVVHKPMKVDSEDDGSQKRVIVMSHIA
jgi:hypothetical protein